MRKRVGFIGAGKIGFSLGRHIKEKARDSFAVSGFFSRDPASASAAADFADGRAYGNVSELAADCDMLLLTVPDGQIQEVWIRAADELSGINRRERLFVGHCSGSLSAEIFSEGPSFVSFGSVHPVLSVPDKENSFERFDGAYFTIEGSQDFTGFAADLLSALGNPWRQIDSESKTLYHAACVFVSNLVCGLAYTGEKLFDECGLDSDFAEYAWRALFLGNAENIYSLGPSGALTGPVERGDTATVCRHLEKLRGDPKDIYIPLSRTLIEAAKRKNPGRDYSELTALLNE